MTWRHPSFLWLLTLVPIIALVIVYAWRRRARATARFGHLGTLTGLIAGRSGPWRATRGVLFVAAIACLILALAGPQYGSRTRMLRKRGIDVVVVLDFSKSMLARDVRPNRIDRAKAELSRFIEEMNGDRVGIVAFAGENMTFPMTVDYAAVKLFLNELGPYDMPVGGTAIARALNSAKDLLDRARSQRSNALSDEEEEQEERSQIIVLLTDGEDHEGDPMSVARELGASGIKLYTIGVGSRTGEPIPTQSPDGTWTGYMRDEDGNVITTAMTAENEEQLQAMAEETGGKFFRAREGGVGVAQIRSEMAAMRQNEQRARRVTVHEDRFALILLPGFLFLVLEGILPEAWIGRRRRRS